MADRSLSQLPLAESQDLVGTALFHLVNTLRPDLSQQDRRATADQIGALLVPAASIGTAQLADNAVTNAKLRDSAALSVLGRGANSAGDPGDIVASTDGHALRRSGNALAFGQIATSGIANAAVTGAKIADATITGGKLAPQAVGQQPTFGSPVALAVPANATVLLPVGLHYASNVFPAVSISVNIAGSWRIIKPQAVSGVALTFLLASDGTNVRFVETSGAATSVTLSRVWL